MMCIMETIINESNRGRSILYALEEYSLRREIYFDLKNTPIPIDNDSRLGLSTSHQESISTLNLHT